MNTQLKLEPFFTNTENNNALGVVVGVGGGALGWGERGRVSKIAYINLTWKTGCLSLKKDKEAVK